MSINHVCISGNLTRDAESRMTKSGMAVVKFTVAVNDRRKNQSGEWEDYANFIDCTMFGKYAEKVAPSMTKGTKVCASGKLHQQTWEQDGQKRSKLEVIANDIELPKREKGPSEPEASLYDSDIPF